jgi:dihydrofolate reductase
MIAAVTADGVIGLGGGIPWHYPADLRRFKRLTSGATVIMGRLTWESLGGKPLAGRRNIVVTSQTDAPEGVETFRTLTEAVAACAGQDIWLIGGARIYAEAMAFADRIELTHVPDRVADPAAVRFPPIDPEQWLAGPRVPFADDERLSHQTFVRRAAGR